MWTLRNWPLELIEWETTNSHRLDIRFNPEQDRCVRWEGPAGGGVARATDWTIADPLPKMRGGKSLGPNPFLTICYLVKIVIILYQLVTGGLSANQPLFTSVVQLAVLGVYQNLTITLSWSLDNWCQKSPDSVDQIGGGGGGGGGGGLPAMCSSLGVQ